MRGRSINAFCLLLVWHQITFKVINNDISASCSGLFKNTIPHGKCFGVLYGIYVVVNFLSQVIFLVLLLVSLA